MTINKAANSRNYWLATLAIASGLLLYRLAALIITEPGLYFDEAYYFGWSTTPDFGYYSKPPMVAWTIWLTTSIFGTAEWAVKAGAPIFYTLTCLVIFKTTEHIHSSKAGMWAAIAFMLMPFVTLNSWFITTDSGLLFFWAACAYMFLLAEKTNSTKYWVLAGVFGGLGMLSKYTMILLPFAAVVRYLLTREAIKLLNWKFWLTIAISLLIFSTNLLWQFQYNFPSFTHTLDLASSNEWTGNPAEFIFGQLIVFGPITLVLLLGTLRARYRQQYSLIWYLTWIPLLVFAAKSVHGETYVNWAAFAYASGAVLTGIILSDARRWLKVVTIVVGVLLMPSLYHYTAIQSALNIAPTKNNTPYARIEGWREATIEVAELVKANPGIPVATNNRTIAAYLSYYLPNATGRVRGVQLYDYIQDHYQLVYPLELSDKPYYFIHDKPMGTTFRGVEFELVDKVSVSPYQDLTRNLWVYLVK